MNLHQYHVHNEHVDVLVTTMIKREVYAETIASLWLVNYHGYQEEDVQDLKVEFVHTFREQTITDLKKLKEKMRREVQE